MASFDYEFEEDQSKKDAETVRKMFGDSPEVLDLPDRSKPFVLGKYQAYEGEQPPWISDYAELFEFSEFPSDRVLFDKLLNTRMPEDMLPEDYDQMVYEMELMVRNSKYRPGVYKKEYSDRLLAKLQRPDYISSVISEKTSALLGSIEYFATDYVPQLPVRFLVWSFEQGPKTYNRIFSAISRFKEPVARIEMNLPQTSRDVVRGLDLEGKTAIVTGATSGIGKEVAKSLASRGATVIMPTRNVPACDQMALQWRSDFDNPAIHCSECNLAEMSSVLKFLKELNSQKIVPDYLVNAAAVLKPFITASHSGVANVAIGTNLLSHMAMTEGVISLMDRQETLPSPITPPPNAPKELDLIDKTLQLIAPSFMKPIPPLEEYEENSAALSGDINSKAAKFARNNYNRGLKRVKKVINVTCSDFKDGALRAEELSADGIGALTGVRAYNVSKLGLIAHSQQMAIWLKRIRKSDSIVVQSVDPGLTYGTKLFENTFFKKLHTYFGSQFGWSSVKSVEEGAAPILYHLLDTKYDPSSSNGLHFSRFEVSDTGLQNRTDSFRLKFLKALDELKERAIEVSGEQTVLRRLLVKDMYEAQQVEPKIEEMKQYFRSQSEQFERSLELPMPEMMPLGLLELRPTPAQEVVGSKPLGIGPPDAPLIGDDLRHNWHNITDTLPVQIHELERRLKLAPPEPSPEEAIAIENTKAEFEALKKQIMHERRLKSHITSAYAEPLPPAAGESWWSWVKAKVNDLTKPTINQ